LYLDTVLMVTAGLGRHDRGPSVAETQRSTMPSCYIATGAGAIGIRVTREKIKSLNLSNIFVMPLR
jgi:uncharacterized membrane protein